MMLAQRRRVRRRALLLAAAHARKEPADHAAAIHPTGEQLPHHPDDGRRATKGRHPRTDSAPLLLTRD